MSGEEPLVHRTFCPVIHKKFPESLIWVPICPINVMSDLVFKHNADLIRDKLGYHLVPNRMFTFVTAEHWMKIGEVIQGIQVQLRLGTGHYK